MFPSFLIGLREGLEAALIVGILVAYLVRTDRKDRLTALWIGVAAAVGVSLVVGAILQFAVDNLGDEALAPFVGFTSLLTVALVTTMVFWMQRTARRMKSDLEGHLSQALAAGPVAILATAFFAVVREGIETALFLWSNVQATGGSTAALIGALLGIGAAVALGWVVYKQSVHIDLAKFFTITGVMLIVIAGGVLAYGLHELAAGGVIPTTATAFDITSWFDAEAWYGSILRGVFGFRPAPTVLEVAAWFAYVIPVTWLFLRGISAAPKKSLANKVAAQ
ncbi:MAG: iron uptake transporter permease EfeU [Actinomycetes bacterium]